MRIILLSSASVILALTGCAAPGALQDTKVMNTAAGAGLGCVGGAVVSKMLGRDAAAGCAAGAVVGGLAGFEKARREELAAAAKLRDEAAQVVNNMPKGDGPPARVGDVKTVEVSSTDEATKETKKYQAFDSVTFELPISAKGSKSHAEVMSKVKALAERVADERGGSGIEVAITETDARRHKIALETATVNSSQGKPITVRKFTDNRVTPGIERITVQAPPLKPNA